MNSTFIINMNYLEVNHLNAIKLFECLMLAKNCLLYTSDAADE